MRVRTTATKADLQFANRRPPDAGVTTAPIREAGENISQFVPAGRELARGQRTAAAMRRLNILFEAQSARIAGALHDEASQCLASAHMAIADIARDVPVAVQARLQEVRLHLDEVAQQLRRISHELHPGIVDDLGPIESIKFIGRSFTRRTGVPLAIEAHLNTPCPATAGAALYRFVQEALTNIGEHAYATSVSIAITHEGPRLRCEIRDDGVGFDLTAVLARNVDPSAGLMLMRDRVEALGGTLDITTAPQQGSQLCAVIPLEI